MQVPCAGGGTHLVWIVLKNLASDCSIQLGVTSSELVQDLNLLVNLLGVL